MSSIGISATQTPNKYYHKPSPMAYISQRKNKLVNYNMIFARKTIQMSRRLPNAVYTSNALEVDSKDAYILKYYSEDEAMQAEMAQLVDELKDEVRKEFMENIANKPINELLKFLDSIQRLGIGYHFENEIETTLDQLYENYLHHHANNLDFDLYHASLLFRLLRRYGFYISCDIFKQFVDENGNFKESLRSDVEGMLSLYEASQLRAHGDDILDEAFNFTTSQLKSMVDKLDDEQLIVKVAHALEYPIHKIVARLDTRFYISQYEHNPLHSKTLLKFAKLDFNLLQALHKKELEYLTRWCKGWDVSTRFPYKVRDDILVIYFCTIGAMDERPQHSFARLIYFKLFWLATFIDDVYDNLDISDLQLLTEAIQRWDKGYVKQLPNHLQFSYTIMLDIFEEVRQHLVDKGRPNVMHYVVETWKSTWSSHLQTTKWSREEYIPSLEDYITEGAKVVGGKFLPIIGYLAWKETATQEIFKWAMQYPKAMEAYGKIARIEDDIAEDDPTQELATQKPSAVGCYMKQYKVTNKKQAYEELQKISSDSWKDINHAMLRPTMMPKPVQENILNQARYLCLLSSKGDGFTNPDATPMKKNFELLFKDPIQM